MTLPFGNSRSSATGDTVPSGSTRVSVAVFGSAPAIRSKPKFPTYARPWASTTMSLALPVQCLEMSAWMDTVPSGSRRRRVCARIETTNIDPSGIHPIPEGCPSTSITTSAVPSGSTVDTVWA